MKCRHCGNTLENVFVDLGTAPPSNSYLSAAELHSPERYFPLRVLVCDGCWLVQTEDYAGASELFSEDYAYFSSYSDSWLEHSKRYVEDMQVRLALDHSTTVVELAANDGYLLQYVKASGIPCYGIEPTASTAAAARRKGLEILEIFFGLAVARQLVEQGRSADLVVEKDGSYRVALNDVDGLRNDGDTEYFIRMLNDRPPDVRILRPAGDKQVSPLEEVVIEARADDDYGVRSLELVIKANTGKEKVVPLTAGSEPVAVGEHTVFLEDLNVKPGDVVTYHARATDVGRGRRSTESRSDIFFLEVKPFEEAFVAAQSQAAGMQGSPQLQELAQAQKEIIAATWKLDARARRAGAKQSAADIKAVAEAQTELRARTAEQAGDVAAAMNDPRRRRLRPGQTAAPGPRIRWRGPSRRWGSELKWTRFLAIYTIRSA